MNLSDLTNMIQNSNGKEMSNVEFNGDVDTLLATIFQEEAVLA